MRRLARVAIAQFKVPLIQEGDGSFRIRNFVSQVIGPAAISIQVVKMLVQTARQQPGNDVEILVMMRGEPASVSLGLRNRASERREPSSNFEFSGGLHDPGKERGV